MNNQNALVPIGENCQIQHGFAVRLEARLKNAALVRARESLGLGARDAAEKIGISYGRLLDYESMKHYPSQPTQKKICEFYLKNGVYLFPEEVFPIELHNLRVKKLVREGVIPTESLVSLSEVSYSLLPSKITPIEEIAEDVLLTLSERDRSIYNLNLGMDCAHMSNIEIGKIVGLSPVRINQIIHCVFKKIKYAYDKANKLPLGI